MELDSIFLIILYLFIKEKLKELCPNAESITDYNAKMGDKYKICLASKIIRLEKRKNDYTKESTLMKSNPDYLIENSLETGSFENSDENSIVNCYLGNCAENHNSANFIENLNDNVFVENFLANRSQRYFIEMKFVIYSLFLGKATKKLNYYLNKYDIINSLSLLCMSFAFFLMLKILDFYIDSI